ncbi:ribosome small subunit-dependent GTPase A [Sutcliffiella rhizosphaerae]|uniref:Small ribosomal subunit biogenesis GTPase RsgA n=1 Tax=Sutcliffiella rhizosphaerae TaxID=2880967 RepID=A0ABM8YIP8_9BACI|nr:ribosome small subunit-dependent GTPase A [Sutcliffiella rhizosphaerae]CAG9619754.1 Small ribosomal subunit biogenesis GTPase RsgA [Sutcliffiella rhizosphaerae]
MPEGKIVKALSGFYYVLTADGVVTQCRGRGVFRKNKITPLVGDMVVFQAENEQEGYIMDVLPRKNELVRPPISNIDQAILVFSAMEPEFSTSLLDRFLVLIESKYVTPLICISKMDLLEEEEKLLEFASYYRKIGYEVVMTSTKEPEQLKEILPFLRDKTSVIAGQSGVGKSSLLNVLRPELDLKTNNISTHLGRGKHTTRHVELMEINQGFVADTPGFSSLEFLELEADEVKECFPEFVEKSEHCKFRGCTHIKEPKCAVKDAVEKGDIATYRYEHYFSFVEEIKDRKPRY